MTLKELKIQFNTFLDTNYPKEEIESFYFLLLENKLNLKRIDIALDPNIEISISDELFFKESLEKLKQEIPVQYIIGETEFYGLPFKVNSDTLIPRPETEELVEWIISTTLNAPVSSCFDSAQQPIIIDSSNFSILDIGTGSGCIAISLAKNLSNAKVTALDISKNALEIAKQNASLNEVSVEFIKRDILASSNIVIASKANQPVLNNEITSSKTPRNDETKFNIIVSNPPYVRELEKEEIKNNVLENEPHLALFVKDNNPLLFYDKIASFALKHLKPNGQLFFEINQYLGKETVELLKQKGFQNIELRKDIFGNDRMIRSTKNHQPT